MTKYKSINMNPSLIRKGGRKALKMSKEEVKEAMYSYVMKNHKDILEECMVNGDEKPDIDDFLCSLVDCDIFSKDVYPCYIENWMDYEGLANWNTLSNGFTFFGVYGGPDWTGPIFYILYWDGKKIRGYVPRYGNTVNVDCKGFENMIGEYWEPKESDYKKWFKSSQIQTLTSDEREKINRLNNWNKEKSNVLPLIGPISFSQFKELSANIAYRIANGYPLQEDDFDWDAIKEDIMSRIELF